MLFFTLEEQSLLRLPKFGDILQHHNAGNYLPSIIPDRSRVRHNVTAFTIGENLLELLVFDHFSVKQGASKKPLFWFTRTAVGAKAHIQEIEQRSDARLACRPFKHLHRLR